MISPALYGSAVITNPAATTKSDDAVAINQIPVVVLLIFALIGGFLLKTGLGKAAP